MATANATYPQTDLVESAIGWFRTRLPATWSVERTVRELPTSRGETETVDSLIAVGAPHAGSATLAVESRSAFSPRDARALMPRLARVVRGISGNTPLLVVAPWLSERSRETLAEEGVNYLDLTGNALVRLDHPALFLQSTGAARNPEPGSRGQAKATGTKAARLLRLLIDVRPPYGVRQLAAASGLTAGYVSQILSTLDREALIDRSSRGIVEDVDPFGLLRRWTRNYDVFSSNRAEAFIAPLGFEDLLERLADGVGQRVALTGSRAAARLAPVTAPATVMSYCDAPGALAEQLDLLPSEEGSNVFLLAPYDDCVWQRTATVAGLRFVAPSQVAADCLTGNGRMPVEGEALLEWMRQDEARWRFPDLEAAREAST
ncbi:MAG TPA: helix-turn-helix domain-containing protein [Solirubrobacterales bacterium]|nr:helix-turn-helix domain-containing protein [Solirubrobacterales bacterium]